MLDTEPTVLYTILGSCHYLLLWYYWCLLATILSFCYKIMTELTLSLVPCKSTNP